MLALRVAQTLHTSVERDVDVQGHPTYKVLARVRQFTWSIAELRFFRFIDLITSLRERPTVAPLLPEREFPRQHKRQLIGVKLSDELLQDRTDGLDAWFKDLCSVVREHCDRRPEGLDLLLDDFLAFLRFDEVETALVASGELDKPNEVLPPPASPKRIPTDAHLKDVDKEVDHRRGAVSDQLQHFRANRRTRAKKSTRRSLSLRPAPLRAPVKPRTKSLQPPPEPPGGLDDDEGDEQDEEKVPLRSSTRSSGLADFLHDVARDLGIRIANYTPASSKQ